MTVCPSPASIPHSSEKIRSPETFFKSPRFFIMLPAVSLSMENPSLAANLSPLKILRASSSKRRSGSPTQRIIRFSRSYIPLNSSTRPLWGLYAKALTVKSLRARSSLKSEVNSTLSGRRWSEYSPSTRKVVTSTFLPSLFTVKVPCLRPVSMTVKSAKTLFICSGAAEVVKSKSWGGVPRRLSRTHPPTA